MSKKETNKYLVPIEITRIQPNQWLKFKTYEYKLYADNTEDKFTKIKFIDINGFIIGEHMPVRLQTVYNKAALQVKSNVVKVASEIKNVVDGVTDLAVAAGTEMKSDAFKTAGVAVSLFGKLKNYAQDKLKKEEPIVLVAEPLTPPEEKNTTNLN